MPVVEPAFQHLSLEVIYKDQARVMAKGLIKDTPKVQGTHKVLEVMLKGQEAASLQVEEPSSTDPGPQLKLLTLTS